MAGIIWFLIGAGFCVESVKLKVGGLHNPGAGFLPFWIGLLLMILGLIMVLSTLFRQRTGADESGKRISGGQDFGNLFIPVWVLLILVGYAILLEPLGFLLSSFLALFLLFKISNPKKWLMPIGLSISTAVISYLVFCVWLQSQFPRGILQF